MSVPRLPPECFEAPAAAGPPPGANGTRAGAPDDGQEAHAHGQEAHDDMPEDGTELLDQIHGTITRFVAMPSPEAVDAVVLWIAATHAQPAWQHATRLALTSAIKRSGKSRLLDVIEATCYRPLMTINATVPAIFRSISGDDPPTILVDEADTIFNKSRSADGTEDLRGLFNAGFGRGRPALRCVGPSQTPTEFNTFCMVAFAGIGALPDTITDRAINIAMRRRAPDEHVDSFRRRRDIPTLHSLRDQLSAWIRAALDKLEDAQPIMPVEDRAADAWEPMIAVADLAGESWPRRARAAAVAFIAEADADAAEQNLAVRLLDDIRAVFTEPVITSSALVNRLRDLPESPWEKFDLTQGTLAHKLSPFKIRPDRVRSDPKSQTQARGYKLEDFADAFDRYLTTKTAGGTSPPVTPSQSQVVPVTACDAVTPLPVTRPETVTALSSSCDAVTPCDGRVAEASEPLDDRDLDASLAVANLRAEIVRRKREEDLDVPHDWYTMPVSLLLALLDGSTAVEHDQNVYR